ncbi:MAG: peptidylprolyl isomerase, partial [Myxococcaceae bacterium]
FACERKPVTPVQVSYADAGIVVGRFVGGAVTEEELLREAQRLPPDLRQQFGSPFGQRELVKSLIDKRLLFQEAQRRGLAQAPEIRKQVEQLEERLVIQALLAAEEASAGPTQEQELRAYYEANRGEFAQPERVHLARLLARVPPSATPAERAKARERAAGFAKRLARGETMAKIGIEGDGPERARNGDLGLVARGDLKDEPLEKAAFALTKPGATSPVSDCREGFAVLQLIERREARTPPFEEVKADVEGRLSPLRKRRVFDELIARLRLGADVQVGVAARK